MTQGASQDYRAAIVDPSAIGIEAARFPRGCVASPHHLASAAGAAVLSRGGNAIDAALAANLALGVVMPFACGYGGDLFAIVWDGALHAYDGSGRTPAAASIDVVRERTGRDLMPAFGPHAVSVPGAVDGWFALHERWGSRPLGELAADAVELARDGFGLSTTARGFLSRARRLYADSPSWQDVYGSAAESGFLRQPDLARTITTLVDDGPDAYYRGPIADDIAAHLASRGGLIRPEDLAAHRGAWVQTLRAGYRDTEVVQMPPPTQGVTALEALRVVEATGALPEDPTDRHHLLIEAAKLALSDRGQHVGDPDQMTTDPTELLADDHVRAHARSIDPGRARFPAAARPALGGTIYLCAADRDGLLVSLIQSNFMGFGSGETVPGRGINLQNRAGYMRFEPGWPDSFGPGCKPLHTLIPAMVLRDGSPWLVYGTMGGDSQAQIHLQLLTRMIDDREDPQRALSAPRWSVSATDWAVTLEGGFPDEVGAGLSDRGHQVRWTAGASHQAGWAQAIQVTEHGYLGATDPRPDGAVTGH
ncbi:MAG TPA: gamma-glutamyltransferase family protein [Nitriliruptorales bacterium]